MSRAVPARQLPWRWFPAAMLGSIAVVFAVNGAMIYAAVSTFPGQAGEDGFDLSNAYARVLDAAARQAALGWQLALEPDAGGHVVARVTGGGGCAAARRRRRGPGGTAGRPGCGDAVCGSRRRRRPAGSPRRCRPDAGPCR